MKPDCDISTHGGNVDLLHELQRRGVSFLIVGGAAVAVHGGREETHLDEIDVLIDTTIENAQRVVATLKARGFDPQWPADELTKPRKQVPAKDWAHDIDILTPRADEDFAALLARSVPAVLNDLRVSVIGRDDLIAMKLIAVKNDENPAKHERDLARLQGS